MIQTEMTKRSIFPVRKAWTVMTAWNYRWEINKRAKLHLLVRVDPSLPVSLTLLALKQVKIPHKGSLMAERRKMFQSVVTSHITAYIADSLFKKWRDICCVDTEIKLMLQKLWAFHWTQKNGEFCLIISEIRGTLSTTLKFWIAPKANPSPGDNQREMQEKRNLHIVCIAIDCMWKESCRDIIRFAHSSHGITHLIQVKEI